MKPLQTNNPQKVLAHMVPDCSPDPFFREMAGGAASGVPKIFSRKRPAPFFGDCSPGRAARSPEGDIRRADEQYRIT